MHEYINTKFGIKVDKQWPGMWSFGMCISHDGPETYIFINLLKISISIGKLGIYEEE